jgi:hypothetical protein
VDGLSPGDKATCPWGCKKVAAAGRSAKEEFPFAFSLQLRVSKPSKVSSGFSLRKCGRLFAVEVLAVLHPIKKIKLLVIPEPAERTRTILLQASALPLFTGEETEAPGYVCGKCDSVLIAKTTKLWLLNIVIRCFNCGAYNDTRVAFK